MAQNIHFFCQDNRYVLKNKTVIRNWITRCAAKEHKMIGEITYMFGDDNQVLEANRQYLNHDYLTDILTFDYSEDDTLQGDILISIDRVRENAAQFGAKFENELLRVIIHGVLHLCGYKDKTKKESELMRHKEDEAISDYYNHL